MYVYYSDEEKKRRRNRKIRYTITGLVVAGVLAVGAKHVYDYQIAKGANKEMDQLMDDETEYEPPAVAYLGDNEQETTEQPIVILDDTADINTEEVTETVTEQATEAVEEEVIPEATQSETEVVQEEVIPEATQSETVVSDSVIDALGSDMDIVEETAPVVTETEVVEEEVIPEVTQSETEVVEEPTKVMTEEVIERPIEERATTLADVYASTGAYSSLYGNYSNDDMVKIIQIMNGEYPASTMDEAINNFDYMEDYFTSTLNSEMYMNKVNDYIAGYEDEITSIPYDLDLTDTVLNNQNYNAFAAVDYLDELHKKAMSSGNREEVQALCGDFFKCLANLTYGNGFNIDGVNITIEDIKGLENLGLGSIIEQCTFDLIPFSYGITEVSYIDKEGNEAVIGIDELIQGFNFSGSYYTEWHDDLVSSMTK